MRQEPASRFPLRAVAGRFFRAVPADRATDVLAPPPSVGAGRYHRPGESVLYMSPRADWATIAISGYLREDGRARVVVPLLVESAHVLDLHNAEACRHLGVDPEQSKLSWKQALEAGREPPSWQLANAARRIGADGLIDRSRQIPGGWHLNLFRWNVAGAPTVRVCGEPTAISLSTEELKWGL